jgi:hypothetical protein
MGCAENIVVSGWKPRGEKWRPKSTAVKYSVHSFEICDNLCDDNILWFSPIQIGEWLNELWEERFHSQYKLADDVGMSRVRVQQYFYLLRIPVDLRGRLKTVPGLTEGELRPLTRMDGRVMRLAVGGMAGEMIQSIPARHHVMENKITPRVLHFWTATRSLLDRRRHANVKRHLQSAHFSIFNSRMSSTCR